MHYYKLNIPDWALHTSHLSLVEEAIYFRLINYYYDSEKPIPLETHSVFRRLRMANESDIAETILNEFFTLNEKGYTHKRCDEIIKDYKKNVLDKNRKNGVKGGRPRKQRSTEEPNGLPVDTQEEPKGNLNHKPLTTNQELLTNNKKKSVRFTPPSLEQVQEYCLERGNIINPQGFLDHYESNGWMRGKNKIKDWKACVRTWEQNQKGKQLSSHDLSNKTYNFNGDL